MKQIIQKILISVVGLCASISAYAYDFEVDGIGYTITSFTDLTVCVSKLVDDKATKVIIPESVEYKSKSLKVTDIATGAFAYKTALIEVSLPNTISYIPEKAFSGCTSLTVINFPSNITRIGEYAFSGCTSLTSFSIPDGIQHIQGSTFEGCESLTKIDLPSKLRSIGGYAFKKTGLQTIEIPDSVVSLGTSAFSESALVEIYLPDGIKTIPSACFRGCKELRNITFSSSISYIEEYAFGGCIALQELTLPENLEKIGDGAFGACSALKKISLPENLKSLGDAFGSCESLTELRIPSGVKSISADILWYCPKLSKLTIGKGLSGTPFDRFYRRIPIGNHYPPEEFRTVYYYEALAGSYDIYDRYGTTYLNGLKDFIIEDSNEEFSIKGTVIDGTVFPLFANTNLDYYYVGRPLVDIHGWEGKDYSLQTEKEQGTGHIKKLEIGGGCTSVPYFYQKIDTLKLGENIKEFDLQNIYKEDIVRIECLANVPPKITDIKSNFPAKVYTDATLYVPFGCKEAYEKADVWKNFWNICEISSGESSGISNVLGKENNGTYDVYNVAGLLIGKSYDMAKIKKLPKGIYILTNKSKQCKIKI